MSATKLTPPSDVSNKKMLNSNSFFGNEGSAKSTLAITAGNYDSDVSSPSSQSQKPFHSKGDPPSSESAIHSSESDEECSLSVSIYRFQLNPYYESPNPSSRGESLHTLPSPGSPVSLNYASPGETPHTLTSPGSPSLLANLGHIPHNPVSLNYASTDESPNTPVSPGSLPLLGNVGHSTHNPVSLNYASPDESPQTPISPESHSLLSNESPHTPTSPGSPSLLSNESPQTPISPGSPSLLSNESPHTPTSPGSPSLLANVGHIPHNPVSRNYASPDESPHTLTSPGPPSLLLNESPNTPTSPGAPSLLANKSPNTPTSPGPPSLLGNVGHTPHNLVSLNCASPDKSTHNPLSPHTFTSSGSPCKMPSPSSRMSSESAASSSAFSAPTKYSTSKTSSLSSHSQSWDSSAGFSSSECRSPSSSPCDSPINSTSPGNPLSPGCTTDDSLLCIGVSPNTSNSPCTYNSMFDPPNNSRNRVENDGEKLVITDVEGQNEVEVVYIRFPEEFPNGTRPDFIELYTAAEKAELPRAPSESSGSDPSKNGGDKAGSEDPDYVPDYQVIELEDDLPLSERIRRRKSTTRDDLIGVHDDRGPQEPCESKASDNPLPSSVFGGSLNEITSPEMQISSSPFVSGNEVSMSQPTRSSCKQSRRKFWEHIKTVKRQKTENESVRIICLEVEYIKRNNETTRDLTQIGCSVLCVNKDGIVSPSENIFFRVIQPPRMTEYLSMKIKGDLLKSLHIQQNVSGHFEFRDEFEVIDDKSPRIKCITENKAVEELIDFLSNFDPCVLVSLEEEAIVIVQAKILKMTESTSQVCGLKCDEMYRLTSWNQLLNHLGLSSEDTAMDFEDWFVKNMNHDYNKISLHPHALDISAMLSKAIKHVVEIKNDSNLYQSLNTLAFTNFKDKNISKMNPNLTEAEPFQFLEIFNSLRPHLAPTIYFESVDVIDLSSDSDNGEAKTVPISWSILPNAQQHSNLPWNQHQSILSIPSPLERRASNCLSSYYTSGNRNIQASSTIHLAPSPSRGYYTRDSSGLGEEGLLPTTIYPQHNLFQIINSEMEREPHNQNVYVQTSAFRGGQMHFESPNQPQVQSTDPGISLRERYSRNQINHPVQNQMSGIRRCFQNQNPHHIESTVFTAGQMPSPERSQSTASVERGRERILQDDEVRERNPPNSNRCTNSRLGGVCTNNRKATCSFKMCGLCCKEEKKNESCKGHKYYGRLGKPMQVNDP